MGGARGPSERGWWPRLDLTLLPTPVPLSQAFWLLYLFLILGVTAAKL